MMLASCGADLVEREDNHLGLEKNLAEKYGADEYGMRQYVMAFLYLGPNQRCPGDSIPNSIVTTITNTP